MTHAFLYLLPLNSDKAYIQNWPSHSGDQAKVTSFYRRNNSKYVPSGKRVKIILFYMVCSSAFYHCDKMTQINNFQGELFYLGSWFQPVVIGSVVLGLQQHKTPWWAHMTAKLYLSHGIQEAERDRKKPGPWYSLQEHDLRVLSTRRNLRKAHYLPIVPQAADQVSDTLVLGIIRVQTTALIFCIIFLTTIVSTELCDNFQYPVLSSVDPYSVISSAVKSSD